ncbi:MAG: DUF169 domain-containing protein [Candidatus Methanomethylophilaceae archaeon]|nr:DUF169 domain-containing protein [Candidatus Methanomethylophilaceae archaeon]
MTIADLLRMEHEPVAIYRTKSMPEGARVPSGHCSMPPLFLMAFRKGETCAADREHVFCHGGVSGLGFGPIPSRQRTAWSCSVVPEEVRKDMRHAGSGGQREYADSEAALAQMSEIRDFPDLGGAIVFEPLSVAESKGDPIEVVALLSDSTRISALIVLAGYDKRTPGSAVKILHAHACQEIYVIPKGEGESDEPHAVLGMTDLYARRFVEPWEMSFAAPYVMWRRMESNAGSSFLTMEKWEKALAASERRSGRSLAKGWPER